MLIKYGPTGTKLWTKEFGTAGVDRAVRPAARPAGPPVIVGYTKGNLDGDARRQHERRRVRRRRYDPNGNREWVTQVGTDGRRPRLRPRDRRRRLDLRRRLHEGRARRPARRRQGRLPAQARGRPAARRSGSASSATVGEDKGMAVAAGGGDVYVAGMVGDTLGTPVPGTTPGGIDGFLAQFDASGTRDAGRSQLGTIRRRAALGRRGRRGRQRDRRRLHRAAICSRRTPGDKDIVVAALRPGRRDDAARPARHDRQRQGRERRARRRRQHVRVGLLATATSRRTSATSTRVLIKYGPGLTRQWARQFGTTESDGADAFAEGNVFLATHGATHLGVRLHDGQHGDADAGRQRRRVPDVVRRPGPIWAR